jgi:hypothetical protein
MTYRSQSDRAIVAVNTILRIISDAEQEPDLPPGELQCWLWRYLHSEFDAIAREMAGDCEALIEAQRARV